MKYNQSLVKTIEPVRLNTLNRLNKSKGWKHGYNKEHDFVVISKTGQIGEVLEIQGLKVALPLAPKSIYSRSKDKSEQKWEKFEENPIIKKIKTVFDWQNQPESFKEEHYAYIDEEFNRRDNGFWFMNNGSSQ